MFRIGEFSKLTQVSIRMLRYYDETELLKPIKTDMFTNYRMYSTEQIPVLNKIVFLRDLGFNVAEIKAALNNWSDEFIAKLLDEKRIEIKDAVKSEQSKLFKIRQAKKDIKKEKLSINCNVSIKSVPSFLVFSLRRIVDNYYAEGMLWQEMMYFAKKNNIALSSDTFTIYHDTEYKENNVDIEVCAPVSKIGHNANGFTFRATESVPIMACMMVYGEFNNIAKAYSAFANWLQEHNQYRMTGKTRQIVHRGPWNEEDCDKYLTEIQVPLKELTKNKNYIIDSHMV